MISYEFTDPDGCIAKIRSSKDHAPGAYLLAPDGSFGVQVPAHRLADFTRMLWSAASQPVPDLPVIHDPAMVAALCRLLHEAMHGENGHEPGEDEMYIARKLLDAGWRKQ